MNRRLSAGRTCAAAALAALTLMPFRAFGAAFDQHGSATIPVSEADLGRGMHLSTGDAANDTCVVGESSTKTHSGPIPQITSVQIHDNRDASSFFQRTDVSASAQVHAFLGNADTKTSFVTSHHFTQNTANISIYETVEQREYLVPSPVSATDVDPASDPDEVEGIRLKRHYRQLLAKSNLSQADIDNFKRACGDGYIASIISGAELTGALTIQDVGSEDNATSNVSLDVSGLVGEVKGAVDKTISTTTKDHHFSLNYIESGGSGGSAPVDEQTLLKAVGDLPQQASKSPNPFRVVVRDYRDLQDFPPNVLFETPTPLDKVLNAYWRLDAVIQLANDALSPGVAAGSGSPEFFWIPGGPSVQSVRELRDEMMSTRNTLMRQATECSNLGKCDEPVVSAKDIYKFAVRMPLPKSAKLSSTMGFEQRLNALQSMVASFNNEKRYLYSSYSSWMPVTRGNCYARDLVVTKKFEAEGYPGSVQARIDAVARFLTTFSDDLVADTLEFYVRGPASKHCELSPQDTDCNLHEDDFKRIGDLVPRVSLRVSTNFNPDQTYRFECPGSIPKMKLLTAELVQK